MRSVRGPIVDSEGYGCDVNGAVLELKLLSGITTGVGVGMALIDGIGMLLEFISELLTKIETCRWEVVP